MIKRSIPMSIFLSVITFGIYGLVWFYSITKSLIEELEYGTVDSAPLNLLYVVLTLGLYIFWWNYKISTYISTIERRKNIEPDFWAPILSIWFGLVLHQSRINRICVTK